MKKVSLKQLKKHRDELNALLPNYLTEVKEMFYITSYDHDIETKTQIYNIDRKPFYAQRSNANWSYFLVLGRPRTQKD
jgi:hypothetical protein